MPQKIDSYTSPGDPVTIELDPQNDGSIIRKAFLFEGFANFMALPLITHPLGVLSSFSLRPAQINPSSALWSRSLGVLFVSAITGALWAGVPNTKTAIESRRTVYIMLGLGELALIPLFLLEASKNGGSDAALSPKASLVAVSSLVPLFAWRLYVLYVKPELIGRYKEVKRE